MQFHRSKSFGPRISLTERQIEALVARCNAAGLTCHLEQCHTGSVYILIGLPEWEQNIHGEWFSTLDCGCNEDVAKIRLSGHDEGRIADATHNCVGTKAECMAALKQWLPKILEEHGPKGKAIIEAGPPVAQAVFAEPQLPQSISVESVGRAVQRYYEALCWSVRTYCATTGSEYVFASHPSGDEVKVRISDHATTTRDPEMTNRVADPDFNLVVDGDTVRGWQDFADVLWEAATLADWQQAFGGEVDPANLYEHDRKAYLAAQAAHA